MNILYLGDIMGELGMQAVERWLPGIIADHHVDVVLAQLENLSDGKGIRPADFERMRRAGVHFGTGGNWSLHLPEAELLLSDPNTPLIRPANYPEGTPGLPYKYLKSEQGDILVVSLMGQIVGRDADRPVDNPLQVIDQILETEANHPKVATVINLHGDFSSEKLVIGHYLAGRATIVVGDHWHVPTADTQIFAGGTAHQTDVGMCGSLDSCIGVKFNVIEQRWRHNIMSRNELETTGRLQLNGLLATIEDGKATAIERIRLTD